MTDFPRSVRLWKSEAVATETVAAKFEALQGYLREKSKPDIPIFISPALAGREVPGWERQDRIGDRLMDVSFGDAIRYMSFELGFTWQWTEEGLLILEKTD